MSGEDDRSDLPVILSNALSVICSPIVRCAPANCGSAIRISTDPSIVLGVGAALVFAFILDGPPQIAFGVFTIGFLTALIETRLHEERGKRKLPPEARSLEAQIFRPFDHAQESDASQRRNNDWRDVGQRAEIKRAAPFNDSTVLRHLYPTLPPIKLAQIGIALRASG
jgi:hypothetical protein